MDTLHTVLNRGCSTWDRELAPLDEFHSRLERVREGMRQRALDLLLVYGDSWKFGHLAYVSHFLPKNRGALALIPLEGEPALVVQEPSRNNPFSKTLTWIEEVHSVGRFAQGISESLKSRALEPKRIGLVAVKEQLNIREWNELVNLFQGTAMESCSDLLTRLRILKSPLEIDLLRRSSRILEQALSLFEKEARPGQMEYEAAALIEREARRQGVEGFRFLMARSSEPGIGLRPAAPRLLSKGEAILITVASSYQRYWTELGQTFYLGSPPQEAIQAHQQALAVFRRLLDELSKEGYTAGTRAWLREIVPSSEARDSLEAYGLGNGIGLDLVEEPILRRNGSVEIRDGMALTLRVCLHGGNGGRALIARPFWVTSGRVEGLVNLSEGLVSIGV